MKFIVNDQMVLLRAPEGSLAPYIVSFSEWVIGQGYAQCSLRQRVRIAADCSATALMAGQRHERMAG